MGCLHSSSSFDEVKIDNGAVYIAKNEPLAIWEYLEDINSANWVPYDEKTARQINIAYTSAAKKCQITNKSNGYSVEIDFSLMLETNVVNGWQRKVRTKQQILHEAHAAGIKSSMRQGHHQVPQQSVSSQLVTNEHDPNPLLQQEPSPHSHRKKKNLKKHSNSNNSHRHENNDTARYKWQWFSESIGWKDYDEKLSNKIDEAYAENVARYAFKIRSNNTKYEIDFDRLKQCNLDTMKLRTIRRMSISNKPHNKPHKSSPIQASSHSNHDKNMSQAIDDILNAESERFVWEHFDESDRKWHEYGDNVCLKIETVHHSNAAIARMKIHGIEYEIRLNEAPMNQFNLRTGKISPIRRMIKSKHVKRESNIKTSVDIPIVEPYNKAKYQWRYKQGFNVWKVYPNDINIEIEKAFQSELDRFAFTINNQQYEIQFNFLRQINVNTNDVNEIARIDSTAQKRSHTMFNKAQHESAKSFNPSDIDIINHIENQNKKKKNNKHNKRSATMDVIKNQNGANDFDFLVKQQQKAMKYFKVKHSKRNSSKPMEDDDNIINENDTEDDNDTDNDAEIDSFRWIFKHDEGGWDYYSSAVSFQIEEAYRNGADSIDVTKDGVIYEIHIEHELECHVATNKMRAIKRVNAKSNINYNEINFEPKPKPKPKTRAHNNIKVIDLDNQFDALSNKLDDFGDEKEHEEFSEYDEHDDDEKDGEIREETTPRNPAVNSVATPADSEFALKEYGNDYNEYVQKFNNLNQGYFD